MRQNPALDIAEFQTFDAVHACLSGRAPDRRKTLIFTAVSAPPCDQVVVFLAIVMPPGLGHADGPRDSRGDVDSRVHESAQEIAVHRQIPRRRHFDALAYAGIEAAERVKGDRREAVMLDVVGHLPGQ